LAESLGYVYAPHWMATDRLRARTCSHLRLPRALMTSDDPLTAPLIMYLLALAPTERATECATECLL
jgi:hypothetical protein